MKMKRLMQSLMLVAMVLLIVAPMYANAIAPDLPDTQMAAKYLGNDTYMSEFTHASERLRPDGDDDWVKVWLFSSHQVRVTITPLTGVPTHIDVAFNAWLFSAWKAGADDGGIDYEESRTFQCGDGVLYLHIWEGWRESGTGFYILLIELDP